MNLNDPFLTTRIDCLLFDQYLDYLFSVASIGELRRPNSKITRILPPCSLGAPLTVILRMK